jgi:hypothetical protein
MMRTSSLWQSDGEMLSALGPLPRATLADALESEGYLHVPAEQMSVVPLELKHAEDAAPAMHCHVCEFTVERLWNAISDQLHAERGPEGAGEHQALRQVFASACDEEVLQQLLDAFAVSQMASSPTPEGSSDDVVANILMFMATKRNSGAPVSDADKAAVQLSCKVC